MHVLVAEPSVPVSNALRKFLEGTADVHVVHYVDEAVQVVRSGRPLDVVFASVSGSFDGEVLCAQVKKTLPDVSVVLLYPPTEHELAPRRSADAGADAFLVGPLKKHMVVSVARATTALHELRGQLRAQTQALEALKTVQATAAQVKKPFAPKSKVGGLNVDDDTFFKKYMLLEVKRSKRYEYPVALVIIALDHLEEHLKLVAAGTPDEHRGVIRAEALKALSELVRDIDIALPFAEDRYLLFLPHTPRAGAFAAAQRVVDRLRKLSSFEGGTVSLGVASYDPKIEKREQVSFGGLVREATELVKKAQAAGGNRVEGQGAPVDSKPKKSRISMG